MWHGVIGVTEEEDGTLYHSLRNLNKRYVKQISVWSSVSQQVLYESVEEIFFLFIYYH